MDFDKLPTIIEVDISANTAPRQTKEGGIKDADSIKTSMGGIRLVHTGCFMLTYLAMGLASATISTSMIDLQEIVNTSVDRLSVSLSARDAGHIVGSLIGGQLSNRYRKLTNVIGGVMVVLSGLLFLLFPWSPNFAVLCISGAFRGLTQGVGLTMLNAALIAEWGSKAPSPVNALHLVLAVGLLFGPMMTSPFLSHTMVSQHNLTYIANNLQEGFTTQLPNSSLVSGFTDYTSSTERVVNMTSIVIQTDTKIIIPFGIIGLITMLPGFAFIFMYIIGWRYGMKGQQFSTSIRVDHPSQPPHNHGNRYTIIMTVICSILFILIAARDGILTEFIFYIAVNYVGMSKNRAALLNTANYGCWVFGRTVVTIITRCIPIYYLSFGFMATSFAFNICLCLFGLRSELLYWVFVCMFQLFAGPLYACMLTWVDHYVEVDGIMMSGIEIGGGLGAFLYHFLGGFIIDYCGPIYVLVFSASAALILFIMMLILQVFWHKTGHRFKSKRVIESDAVSRSGETTPLLQSAER